MKKAISTAVSVTLAIILSLSLFQIFQISASASEAIPAQYNADIKNPMYVTSIKNQGDYGICWAFSAVSCCESEAIKNHGANKDTIDFSELHLAYFAYNAKREGTGDEIVSNMPFYELGGDVTLPVFTLANWIGLVSEETAKFEDFLQNPQITLDEDLANEKPEYYIKNAYLYDYATEKEQIKQAIMTFGAVQTGYFADDAFMNAKTSAYYCPHNYTMNHAISIIGWDDNYSKENFKSTARPSSDGAWLVKNSWGTEKGERGYFWLSYENVSIKEAIAYDVEPAESFFATNNYQHDGGFSLVYYEYDTIEAANIFKAEATELLTAVSVFAHEAQNTPYTVRIYKNPQTLSPSTFKKGTLVLEQSGTLPFSGYSTVELNSSIRLEKGDTFIVCIETSAILGFDSEQSISNGTDVVAKAVTSVLPNQTYVAFNGSGFYDLGAPENSDNAANVRIKAFTQNLIIKEASVVSAPTLTPIEYGLSIKESSLSGGVVADALTGETISGKWKFKDENAIVCNGESVEVIFTPDDQKYLPITATVKAVVLEVTPIIKVSFNSKEYTSGKPIIFNAVLKNPNLSSLADLGTLTYTYRIDDGEEKEFEGNVFNAKDLEGTTLYITVSSSAVEGKYLAATYTESFVMNPLPVSDIQSETVTETVATETLPSTDRVIDEFTEIETDTLPESESSESINESERESINESIKESAKESIKESVEESVRESVKDKVKDDIVNTLTCGASISFSALFTVFALSALATTKKRKR